MRLLPLLFALSALASAAMPAGAQWKWKDARGQVHVSDIPPPREIQDKDILQRPAPVSRNAVTPAVAAAAASAASAPPPRPTKDPEIEARRAQAELEQKAKAKAEAERIAAQRAENCQRARQHVAALSSGQRLTRMNAQGEREVLDDKARAEEAAVAQRVIDADCR